MKEINTSSITKLVDSLEGNATESKIKAVTVQLAKIGTSCAMDALIKLTGHKRTFIRIYSLEALGIPGNTLAVDTLIANLKDQSMSVLRYTSAKSLGIIGDPNTIDALVDTMLNDPDEQVQKDAAEAISKISDPRALEVLTMALKNPNCSVRVHAAEALSKVDNGQKIDEINSILIESSAVRASFNSTSGTKEDQPIKNSPSVSKNYNEEYINHKKWQRKIVLAEKVEKVGISAAGLGFLGFLISFFVLFIENYMLLGSDFAYSIFSFSILPFMLGLILVAISKIFQKLIH